MTLDEAIQHAQEIANKGCDQCAKDHQQLAEWLTELKNRREEDTNSAKSMQLLHNDKRLCSIYNIKDGDILYYNKDNDRWIFIFRDINGINFIANFIRNDMKKYQELKYYAFCFEELNGFVELHNSCLVDITKIKFATDEQKQILYDALKTYGYKWNPEIKKLIEQ